jgi:large subunit ribosomal protein L3
LLNAVTIIETPPLILYGVKVYKRDEYGLNAISEIWAPNLPKELARKIQVPNLEKYNFEEKLKIITEKVNEGLEIRGLFLTQPYKTCVPRIKPDIIEMKMTGGANSKEQFDYVKNLLGQEIKIRDCIPEGSLIDSISVSKGKGFQGLVKKFGVKLLPRKNRKGKRRIGSIGPISPSRVLYTVARSGQMGLHQRPEYHKRIMKISEDGEEINPKGGFIRYGLIRNEFVMLLGSVPGAKKRLIRLRNTIRPKHGFILSVPEITYISKNSHQGK